MTRRWISWGFAVLVMALEAGAGQAGEASGVEVCRSQAFAAKNSCYQAELEKVLLADGTEKALAVLGRVTSDDPDSLREAHSLVHHIGQRSFSHYGTAPLALSHCRDVFWSGCYHGVLQAYLSSLPTIEPENIVPLCPTSETVSEYSFQRYNCLHGLGHGLTMQFRYDVLRSLSFCDALLKDWDRESCYGGVFMENIIAFQSARRANLRMDHHDHEANSFLNAQDLLYPCSVLTEKYLRACYLIQASAILTFLNYDFAKAFEQCERVQEEHQTTCYRSLGREISGFTLRDVRRVNEMCRLGRSNQVQECFIGAVKDFVLTDASPDQGLALCRSLDPQFKKECYVAVGEMIVSLFNDKNMRAQSCRKGEEDYIESCLKSAADF